MAKKTSQKNAPVTPASPGAEPAPTPLAFESAMDAGDFGRARKLAEAALASGPDADVRARAQRVVDGTRLDSGQLALVALMLVVLAVVFVRGIVMRNADLASMPSHADVSKAIIKLQAPEPAPAPAAPAQEPGAAAPTP